MKLKLKYPLLVLTAMLVSCYYDNQEDLYPTIGNASNCQEGQVSFSAQVLPLMNTNCNQSGCHNALDRGGNIVLDNYTDLLTSAEDGSLLGSIKHAPGFIAMPDGAAKLDICSILLVEQWINQGSLNN